MCVSPACQKQFEIRNQNKSAEDSEHERRRAEIRKIDKLLFDDGAGTNNIIWLAKAGA